jgi:hypothetical protein
MKSPESYRTKESKRSIYHNTVVVEVLCDYYVCVICVQYVGLWHYMRSIKSLHPSLPHLVLLQLIQELLRWLLLVSLRVVLRPLP